LTTSAGDQTKKSIEEIAPPLPRAKIALPPPHAFVSQQTVSTRQRGACSKARRRASIKKIILKTAILVFSCKGLNSLMTRWSMDDVSMGEEKIITFYLKSV